MRHRRGILLFSVLIVAAILAMMVTAMVQMNAFGLGLTGSAAERSQALQNCYSAVDYARARLQGEPTWGAGGMGAAAVTKMNGAGGGWTVTEQGTDFTSNLAHGAMGDSRFDLQVLNNAAGTTAVPHPVWARRAQGVPPHAVLLAVDGRVGRGWRHMELLLRRGGLPSASLQAAGDLAITTDNTAPVEFKAVAGSRNALRSRGNTYLPSPGQILFGTSPGDGSVYAASDVYSGGTASFNTNGTVASVSGGTWLKDDAAARAAAEAASRASIFPGQGSRPSHLNADQLKTPAGTPGQMPAGHYVFRSDSEVDYYASGLDPASATPSRHYSGAIYNGGAGTGADADRVAVLNNYQVMPQGKVEVNGALNISTSVTGQDGKLGLGYSSDGELDPSGSLKSYLTVKGNVDIEGDLSGAGSLIVQAGEGAGDLTLNARSSLSSAPDRGLAIHAAGNVEMKPVSPDVPAQSDTFYASDWEALKLATAGSNPGTTARNALEGWFDPLVQVASKSGAPGSMMGGDDDTFGDTIRDTHWTTSAADYKSQVLSKMDGWPSTTPGGQPLAPYMAQIDAYLSDTTSGSPYIAGMSIGRHFRLREFIKSIDAGAPEPKFLALVGAGSSKNDVVRRAIRQQLTSMALENNTQNLLHLLQTSPNPYLTRNWRDSVLKGLLYAKGSINVGAARRLDVQGLLGTENGHLSLQNLHGGVFQMDDQLLESLLDLTKIPLVIDQFWLDG